LFAFFSAVFFLPASSIFSHNKSTNSNFRHGKFSRRSARGCGKLRDALLDMPPLLQQGMPRCLMPSLISFVLVLFDEEEYSILNQFFKEKDESDDDALI
jgi:hypothetical protein